MGYFVIRIIIWSFSIYGFIDFWKETWLDVVNYIVKVVRKILKYVKKWLIKRVDNNIIS